MIKIFLPSNNLNCYGININLFIITLYIDMFKLENKFKGIFYKISIRNKTSLNGYFYFNGFIKVNIWYLFNKSYRLRLKLYPIKYLIRIYDYINDNCIYKLSSNKGNIDLLTMIMILVPVIFITFILTYNLDTVINGIPILKQAINGYKDLIQALTIK